MSNTQTPPPTEPEILLILALVFLPAAFMVYLILTRGKL